MIPIQNIYYMLSYAFQILTEQGYKSVAVEEFNNTAELCAAILSRGIAVQIKRGLGREYIPVTESRSVLRGRLEIAESIKNQTILKRQMVCSYDDFSVNCYMNQIIKSTVLLLLKSDITKLRKKKLRKLMVYFQDVAEIDIHHVQWDMQYNSGNQTYRMLIAICYLILHGLLQTQADGSTKLMDFLDEKRMCYIYEKFILKYYQKEFPQIKANASQIPWQLDDDERTYLPIMQSDIMLSYQKNILIIDAKYYGRSMQQQFDKHILHAANLYQIFAYVKNKAIELAIQRDSVSGMLLYARTDETVYPNNEYQMSGNKICVRTLDLKQSFEGIKQQLNAIANEYLLLGNDNLCELSKSN